MLVSKLREINIYLSDEEIKLCGLWMAVQAMRAEERVREGRRPAVGDAGRAGGPRCGGSIIKCYSYLRSENLQLRHRLIEWN